MHPFSFSYRYQVPLDTNLKEKTLKSFTGYKVNGSE
jgi:hypothetical protein